MESGAGGGLGPSSMVLKSNDQEAADDEVLVGGAVIGVDQLPPGFRFHPTDDEIIMHYLIMKVMDIGFAAVAIAEADFNKCEPWDLPSNFSYPYLSLFSFFIFRFWLV